MNILQMSFSASLLILVIIVIRALAINKLPKKTFLVFWSIVLVRLLIPFSVPSPFSVYSFISNNTTVTETTPAANIFPITAPIQTPSTDITIIPIAPAPATPSLSLWVIIWIAGITLCALYFVIAYVKCYKGFQTSIVVQNDFVTSWLAEHKIIRPIIIKQSSRISSPLTYGIFRPVILVPTKMDWSNEKQLQYIFAHEYAHIRRFDALTKLFLTAALCIHWFNPVVWAMYILSNRDIELSCDEAVVRSFGETTKSSYARILVSMEEKKSFFTPYYNSFSKNVIEERITAIMKIKKTSLIAILVAITLITGVTTVFATSAIAQDNKPLIAIPNTDFTIDEYDKLLALQFDGYENMTVIDYREKACKMIDKGYPDYMELLNRMDQNTQLSEMRYTNEVASFLNNTLFPLISENWREVTFSNYIDSPFSRQGDGGRLEYYITRTIIGSNQLTVGEHDRTIKGIMDELKTFIESKNSVELQDKSSMSVAIQAEINRIISKWETKDLKMDISYYYTPLIVFDIPHEDTTSKINTDDERGTPGTESDYQSFLTLKTPDYQSQSVADFNYSLLEWATENREAHQRILEDYVKNDIRVNLTDEELLFLTLTFSISNAQNAIQIRNGNYGDPKIDLDMQYDLITSEVPYVWYKLWYQISIKISDANKLTIGARDRYLSNVINGMQTFWNEKGFDELATVNEETFHAKLNTLVSQNSNNLIRIEMNNIYFEGLDERNIMNN